MSHGPARTSSSFSVGMGLEGSSRTSLNTLDAAGALPIDLSAGAEVVTGSRGTPTTTSRGSCAARAVEKSITSVQHALPGALSLLFARGAEARPKVGLAVVVVVVVS